jgi:hypothetical protein
MSEKLNIPQFVSERSEKLRTSQYLKSDLGVFCQYIQTLDLYTWAGFITEADASKRRKDICIQIQYGNLNVNRIKAEISNMFHELNKENSDLSVKSVDVEVDKKDDHAESTECKYVFPK